MLYQETLILTLLKLCLISSKDSEEQEGKTGKDNLRHEETACGSERINICN